MAVKNKRGTGKPFKKGQSGNPNGRPKGQQNKVTRELKEAILNAFTKVGGEDYLVVVAKENPQTFCALLGKVLPTQVTGEDGKDVRFTISIK